MHVRHSMALAAGPALRHTPTPAHMHNQQQICWYPCITTARSPRCASLQAAHWSVHSSLGPCCLPCRRRWTPQLWRSPRTGGWSKAWRCTWWRRGRGCRGTRRAAARVQQAGVWCSGCAEHDHCNLGVQVDACSWGCMQHAPVLNEQGRCRGRRGGAGQENHPSTAAAAIMP